MTDSDDSGPLNLVHLRGRLGASADERELPSGDVLASFRLTVDRPLGEKVRVDSLECTTIRARVRRSVLRADAGDLIELTGSLRRRFWRSPAGPSSRYSVDVATLRVIRPGRRDGASRDRMPASA